MPDREKVIKNLQSVANVCALNGDIQSMRMIDDAIILLKDLEPLEPIVTTNAYGKKFYKCANCGFDFELDFGNPRRVKVCRNCGQGVKWDG